MKSLKVGFVLDDTLDSTDGVQQYVLNLGAWLADEGHEVHYLVGSTERTDIANIHSLSSNIKVRFNGNRMSMPLPARKDQLEKLLESECFDVIHVQMPYSPWLGHRIITAAPKTTAVVGTFHIAPNSQLVRLANRGLGLWTRSSLKSFDRIVSVSSAAADFARSTYGIETEIVPNVVKTEQFKNAEPFSADISKPSIVFLGRLVPRKGCRTLLEALHQLQVQSIQFTATVCGKGPLETELKEYVQSNGLDGHVRFVGYVSEEDKARHLKSADIAVFPSTGGESFGIVLIEAMAAGSPVVLGADNPGYASVLQPFPDLLFPAGDADALSEKLQELLADESKRKAALEWQLSYVRQFDVALVGNKILEIYSDALRSRSNVQ